MSFIEQPSAKLQKKKHIMLMSEKKSIEAHGV